MSTDTDTSNLDALVPPDPDAAPGSTPPAKPKRPTTRAGRKAAAAKRAASPATPKADAKPKPQAPRKSSLETRLAGSLTTVGLGVAAAGGMTSEAVQRDGILIITNAPNIAKALADIAAGNPAVAANLERMLAAGTYAALVAAVMPLVIGIGANHGVIPPHVAEMVGVELPDLGTPPAPQSNGVGLS